MRLDHVQLAIEAGSEDAHRAFWVGCLGFEEEAKPQALAARGGLWVRHGDVRVHLGVEDLHRPALKAHPAFAIADIEALAERLEAYPVDWDDAIPGLRRFFTADPSGNRIEILEER
ncbi:VOC family protein [Aestuariibius sp. 2305UL40-4]|uniref:VOC family protein n=1 Tax=Aestuariibius violaceus TaxID=3234132 RepID=UPI00345ED1DA